MEYLMLLLIPLIAALDWFRGQGKPEGTGTIKKLALGLAMGFAMGFTQWPLALASALCAIIYANGWGAALGSALRKDGSSMGPGYESYWQSEFVDKITFGLVRSNPLFAMAIRGVWGYMFLLPLAYFNPWTILMLPILAASFSLPTLATNDWKTYEIIRGTCTGLGCVAIGFL
jgi:hypothetical protein